MIGICTCLREPKRGIYLNAKVLNLARFILAFANSKVFKEESFLL